MKAMILAAGYGTRLRPLTDQKPKALMPVANRPVIDRVIAYLKAGGVTGIVVNAHHHREQLVHYLDKGRPFGLDMDVRMEPEILGTGGGIKNTADFWDTAPFVVINVDILTNIDLVRACDAHRASGALVTLVLHDYGPCNQVRTDGAGHILEIMPRPRPGALAFTGIHIMNPELLDHIPGNGYSDIIDSYRNLIHADEPIHAFISEGHYWRDMGSIESYREANRELAKEPLTLAPGCRVDPSASLRDWAVIGQNCIVEPGTEIRRSVLWDRVFVRKGIRIIDSIVTTGNCVEKDLIDTVS